MDVDAINVVSSKYGLSLYEAGRPYSHSLLRNRHQLPVFQSA